MSRQTYLPDTDRNNTPFMLPSGADALGNKTGTVYRTGSVGFNTPNPTSLVNINGSVSFATRIVTATTTLLASDHKVIVQNGAANITITLPNALTVLGRQIVFSRYVS